MGLLCRYSESIQLSGSVQFVIIMSECKEDQENQYEDLQQLRERVHLSSNRLLDLTYNDNKYIEKLVFFNTEAKKLINQDLIPEALIYLAEAERVLEYGASCGKTIDRNIIICTLHNEACCYYKEAELATAAKYIEAVIFNLKSHIASIESTPSQEGKKTPKMDELHLAPVQKKIELIHYNLKFCTISSQAKSRQTALNAGKKVIEIAGSLFHDLKQDNPKVTPCDNNNQEMQLSDLKGLVRGVRLFRSEVELGQLQNYLLLTRYYLKKWNQEKVLAKISFTLQKHVNNYSISEVIDMVPMDYIADDDEYYDTFINTRTVMRQLLHFSMGYFTISTQYRLMAEELYRSSQQKYTSEEYIKANIYHLLSILFLSMNLNCDLLFMKQIVSSYEHHFKQELNNAIIDNRTIEELTNRILIEKPKIKSKFNTSLAEKINKLKMKDKDKEKQKLIRSQYEDSYVYDSKTTTKMNESKAKYKTKRSVSKKNVKGLSSNKKLTKVINQTQLEQSKQLLNKNKDRSISINKKPPLKKRSVSKDSVGQIKFGKESTRLPEKNQKRTNDEYQLGQVKVTGRKRLNSFSSAQLSISCRSQDPGKKKTKDKLSKQLSVKKGLKKKEKKGEKKESKPLLNKHYYL